MYGNSLENIGTDIRVCRINVRLNFSLVVPLVLKMCAEVIESHGIVDGIYRLSGMTSNIQKLR